MKKLLIVVFTLLTCEAFAQTQNANMYNAKENGTIYKEHPLITVVNFGNELFLKQDWDGLASLYADTVKFYDPSSEKPKNLADTKKAWAGIFDKWGPVTVGKIGDPDGLKYDRNPFTVQSWWLITAVNKKTGKTAKVYMIQFDEFNVNGKIINESMLYDSLPFVEASK